MYMCLEKAVLVYAFEVFLSKHAMVQAEEGRAGLGEEGEQGTSSQGRAGIRVAAVRESECAEQQEILVRGTKEASFQGRESPTRRVRGKQIPSKFSSIEGQDAIGRDPGSRDGKGNRSVVGAKADTDITVPEPLPRRRGSVRPRGATKVPCAIQR